MEHAMNSFSLSHEQVRAKGQDLTFQAVGKAARGIFDALVAGWDRSRQRRVLVELDERMLRDIGITRTEVAREMNKSFWQR